MEIIATHISSDFDSFAGMIAAKKLYPEAEIVLPGSINQNVRKFISIYEDALPPLKETKDIDISSIKKIIIIDTSIAARLGSLRNAAENKDTEIIVYDHHHKSPEDLKGGEIKLLKIGAVTSFLVNIIKKKKIKINSFEATLFALGIYEDTGSFTFPNTTATDFEAAAFLVSCGANLFVLSKFLNPPLNEEQHRLLEKLISNIKIIKVYEKRIILSGARTDRYIEGLSIITRKLGQVEDIDIAICWVKMKEKTYIVARSDDSSVDVSKIIEVVGGGGHSQAASAILKDMDFDEIENRIIASLYKYIKKPVLVKDIMSYPIRVVNEDESIFSVNELLKKYGHSGIPIVDAKNNIVGIITRKDVDRAIKHGLSHAPVKGFKSRGLVTTGPGSTVEDVQQMMIDNGIGRVPVVQKGEVIGIVTRKDILRFLHGHTAFNAAGIKAYGRGFDLSAEEMRERLKRFLPAEIIKILKQASIIAKSLRYKIYLVGGIVRDILLGISNLDIDIVVEGDGIIFAQKLASLTGARIESHEKFRSAVIILNDNKHLDIATSRIEYYKKPAALPEIEPGSISQDLARRDFTINTLAMSLNKADFARIIDYFGGKKDLAEKRIKVLHKLSFIEDPTRIFRAVRFEQRLGFKMDNQTEKLAVSSIGMNMVSELNGIRIRDELISILNEKQPWKAIQRLYCINALNKINIEIKSINKLAAFIEKVISKYSLFYGEGIKDIEIWRALLAAMLAGKESNLIKDWCSAMKIKKKDAE
ncbi:MAG: CBS domain-containing protein, partial [Actinobacteria bacterium]|nr:CBS domain-containing protein [Actinomycetota bacterium]